MTLSTDGATGSGRTMQELLKERFGKIKKSDFQILNAPSLFVDWSNLNRGLCPFCAHKLYMMRDGKYFRCKSKSHRKSFVISAEKLLKNNPQPPLVAQ